MFDLARPNYAETIDYVIVVNPRGLIFALVLLFRCVSQFIFLSRIADSRRLPGHFPSVLLTTPPGECAVLLATPPSESFRGVPSPGEADRPSIWSVFTNMSDKQVRIVVCQSLDYSVPYSCSRRSTTPVTTRQIRLSIPPTVACPSRVEIRVSITCQPQHKKGPYDKIFYVCQKCVSTK